MPTKEELRYYINNYYGNGQWQAPYWVISKEPGMEKGDLNEAKRAIQISIQLLKRTNNGLTDASEYQRIFREKDQSATATKALFGENVRIQPTWGAWIKIMLAATGQEITREKVREYQARRFLRDGDCCWVDYLPLPCRKEGEWPYAGNSDFGWPETRDSYENQISMTRVRFLREKILECKPESVIFFVRTTIAEQISAQTVLKQTFKYEGKDKKTGEKKEKSITFYSAQTNSTIFHVLPPPSRVTNNGFFHHIGLEIQKFHQHTQP